MSFRKLRLSLLATALPVLLALLACGDEGSPPSMTPSPPATPSATPSATPFPSPTPTATHTSGGSDTAEGEQFDGEAALAHIQALAVDLGPRPSGSEAETAAANYIRSQLDRYGYEVALQDFSFEAFFDIGTTLQVVSPQPQEIAAYPLEPSETGQAEGELLAAGLGRPQDLPAETRGKIALMERGALFFSDKVANAAAAGAVAAIIYNNEPGPFRGKLRDPVPIPTVSISQEDGQNLLALLDSSPVMVRLDVRTSSGSHQSQNVVGQPPDGECRVIVGGHYDSVAAGPGANDNASGTATVLEIARALAADGEFDDVCFVLFGAEEVGLIGSMEFAESLSAAERGKMEGMLNFDMVGVGTHWLLAGSQELRDLAAEEADRLGLAYQLSAGLPARLGSDHSSFIQADIPALIFHRLGDPHYHTAEDQVAFVQEDLLVEIGTLGIAVIQTLLEGR